MRLGGSINSAARSGHCPQLRQRERMTFRRSQSGSVISPCACRAPSPRTAAVTYGAQFAGAGRCWAGYEITSPILVTCHDAPPGNITGCGSNAVKGNYGYVRIRTYSCGQFRLSREFHHSRPALISPPVGAGRGVRAAGFQPGRLHETLHEGGCRRRTCLRQAPELRRRLTALEPGRRAPAGSRDGVLYSQKDPRVRVQLHLFAPFRQAHS